PELEQGIARLNDIDTQQQAFKAQYRSEEDELDRYIKTLNRICAGVSERFNWQLLHQYINYAMPQPHGDRLVTTSKRFEPVRDIYWTNDQDAQHAYAILEQMRLTKNEALSPRDAAVRDDYLKKHLIQINIVGINALYSHNLGDYFRKIHQDGNNLNGMSDEEK